MLGIDVSHYQSRLDVQAYIENNVRFAYVKATDGKDVDPLFREHVKALKSAGILVGAYHFLYAPRKDQGSDAARFSDLVQEAELSLRPVLDFETLQSASKQEALSSAEAFALEVEQRLETEIVVYTGPGFWSTLGVLGVTSWLGRRPLWHAAYPRVIAGPWSPPGAPSVGPAPPWQDWAIWQYTDGRTHGYDNLDRNVTTAEKLGKLMMERDTGYSQVQDSGLTVERHKALELVHATVRPAWEAEDRIRRQKNED